VRQFREAAEAITLEKVLVLPDVPTMGAQLDLRAEGVEDALTVVGVTLRAIPDGLGLRPPSVDVLLFFPPLGTAPLITSDATRVARCARGSAERGSRSTGFRPAGGRSTERAE